MKPVAVIRRVEPARVRRAAVCYALALAAAGCSRSEAAPAADRPAFELTPRQRLTFAGPVVDADTAKDPGVTFGVIPTSPIRAKNYYNVFTGMVESRPVAGNPHPVPVLRAAKVSVFKDRPDVKQLALDRLNAYANEAEVKADSAYAVATDGNGAVRLIRFTRVNVPQDKTDEWTLAGTSEAITLPEHLDDPVADMGRAVLAKEPLPIKGRLLFGRRQQNWGPAELYALDLPGGTPKKIADAVEPRLSVSGSVADRVDMRTLRVTDRRGRRVGQISFEHDEIAEFNLSPDGQRVALSTERMVDVPNALPRREVATLVYTAKGQKLGEFIDYDDPAFMPDGRLLLTAAGGKPGLFVGDLKTGRVEPIVIQDGPGGYGFAPQWPRMPAVSPDGKWVAYVSQRDVCVVGTDGRGWTPVWETPYKEPQHGPTFSPDSRLVAMVVVPLNVMTGPGLVSVFDLKKHVRQPIDTSQGADSEIPLVWQP